MKCVLGNLSYVLAVAVSLSVQVAPAISSTSDQCKLHSDEQTWLENRIRLGAEAADEEDTAKAAGSSPRQLLTTGCGYKTDLMSTLRNGRVLVPLRSGNATYIPIYLSDKVNGYSCVAIEPSVACVVKNEATPEGGRKLTLRTRRNMPATETDIFVPPEGGRITTLLKSENFVLLRARRGSVNVIDDVYAHALKQPCSTPLRCIGERGYRLEREILKFVREERYPWPTPKQIAMDASQFEANLPELTGDEARLHEIISRNEIGFRSGPPSTATDSPYYLGDAIALSSGPSFGPYQIDVEATANPSERAIFERALHRVAVLTADAEYAGLEEEHSLEQPIRQYNTRLLLLFHKLVPLVSAELRSATGADDIRQAYMAYLDSNGRCLARMREIGQTFSKSAFSRLFVVDLDNVVGTSVALRTASQALDLGGVPEDELDKDLETYAVSIAAADARAIIGARARNIRDILAREPSGMWDSWSIAGSCEREPWASFIASHDVHS